MMKSTGFRSLAVLGAFALGACDLDLQDPNLPTEDVAISTTTGIGQIAVGLQAQYSNELVDPVYVVGLVTNEIGAGGATFEAYQKADRGEQITGDDGPSVGPWAGMYEVIRTTNVLIENTPRVGFGPGTTSGLLALAKLYKAMAFGNIYQIYERAPLEVGPTIRDPQFATREQLASEVLRLLQEARGHVQATPPSAEFRASILAPGFNLENTIDAMIARYSLMTGRLDDALAAAQRVNLGVLSELRFSATDPNPLWNLWYNSGNAYQMRAEDQFRLEAETGDNRVAYWVAPAAIQGATGPLDDIRRYQTATASYPVYLPDEMRLIMAEVHARKNNLAQALVHLNEVRTQCRSELNEPVACLPALTLAQLPTQAAMLDEILRQRRYELYLQAVRWSDLRRFNRPVTYPFMPVPSIECDRNANAPREVCAPVG